MNHYINTLDELDEFNRELMKYLIWHNTEKPHRGIGNLPPLRYYLDNFINTPKSPICYGRLQLLDKNQGRLYHFGANDLSQND